MTATMPPDTLAGYTDADIASFYENADPQAYEWHAQLRSEMARRGQVEVYDEEEAGHGKFVSRQEAAAGMVRYARTLGPGAAACGVWEERASDLLRQPSPSKETDMGIAHLAVDAARMAAKAEQGSNPRRHQPAD